MKRKKIGIVTISENIPNYGQRLQLYMVQQLLSKLGYDSEMIQDARWYPNPMTLKANWREIAHCILHYHLRPAEHGFKTMMYLWVKKNIKVSKLYINKDEDMSKLPAKYDGFVVGSDQVWNPYYYDRGANSFTFLQFAPANQRVAYAASIATNTMVEERVDEFKKYLEDFGPISMREESGARIIKELTGRDVPVVLDPTLMCTGEEWASKFVRKPAKSNYLAVFLYYPLTEEYRKKANEIAARKNLSIVYLNNLPKISDYSVESWLGYLQNADHVLTDSFHCVVFSTLFHKDVTIIRHPETEVTMGARIADLLDRLKIKVTNKTEEFADTQVTSWEEVETVLEKKREEAMSFMRSAFPPQE